MWRIESMMPLLCSAGDLSARRRRQFASRGRALQTIAHLGITLNMSQYPVSPTTHVARRRSARMCRRTHCRRLARAYLLALPDTRQSRDREYIIAECAADGAGAKASSAQNLESEVCSHASDMKRLTRVAIPHHMMLNRQY